MRIRKPPLRTRDLLVNLSRLSSFHSHTIPNDTHLIQELKDTKDLNFVLSSHSLFLKSGTLNNHLLNAYVRFQRLENAHNLFDEMPLPNVVSWTSLMGGYIAIGRPKMALSLFSKIPKYLVLPNAFTLSTVISACALLADIDPGKIVHAHVEIYGYQRNLVVCTSLVDMYGKSDDLVSARRVFDSMLDRNIVSWTSMINGYAQNARGYDALKLFMEFNRVESDPPNQFMLACIVNACASLGWLVYGRTIHGVVVKRGYESNGIVSCGLADMYAKCGCIEFSLKVFRSIRNPSVVPYTSVIISTAKHGLGEVSLELFEEMIRLSIRPNDVTFLGILYACSHSGLVDKGLDILYSMETRHGVTPDLKHYTCVVDMLGRKGRLDEAYRLAKTTKIHENSEGALLWGALLSASKLHGRLEIAAEASKWLLEARQQIDSAYVTMSNTYALVGNWDHSQSIRSKMKHVGVRKEPGCSWVEVRDSVYIFYAGNVSSCPRSDEVLDLLKELGERMKERGYVGGSSSCGLVYVDVEEESKAEMVSLHSERLALAFSLISIPKGETIRIMKNLRMCRDCHEAFKLISSIVNRDFVVRDVNRFHHFRNGSCSCRDYW